MNVKFLMHGKGSHRTKASMWQRELAQTFSVLVTVEQLWLYASWALFHLLIYSATGLESPFSVLGVKLQGHVSAYEVE
jgi:hypothetical protein